MPYITESLKHQFAKNIELVAVEKGKLRKLVTEEQIETEVAYFETMSHIEAYPRDREAYEPVNAPHQRYASDANPRQMAHLRDTEVKFPQITRRQLTCSAWYWSATIDRNDKLNLLQDPSSRFSQMSGLAMARAIDRAIIKSVGAPVGGGIIGANPIPFNVAEMCVPLQLMNDDNTLTGFAPAQADNSDFVIDDATTDESKKRARLTVEKLIMAREMLNVATFNTDEKMYFVCSSVQLTDLLNDERVSSNDYNAVKSLVRGELSTYMGFEFIISDLLTGITGPTPVIPAGANSIRECFAFTESALRFATVKGSDITRVDELPTKHYAKMLYHSLSFGSARANENGIVIVKCLEPKRANHTAENGWVVAAAAANDAGNIIRHTRASIVPANASSWGNGIYANDNVISQNGFNLGARANTQAKLLELIKRKL